MKHAIDRAEKDLMRQVARRREMENEMNSMKKKNNIMLIDMLIYSMMAQIQMMKRMK